MSNSPLFPLMVATAMLLPGSGSGASNLEKSIRDWATCDGAANSTEGVARAFAAARHAAFTLIVDCPVHLRIGDDIARTLFIDDGTTVQFTGAGKFIVDNVLHPAFVIANSSGIVLTNWNVEYDASLPVNWKTGGYQSSGAFVASSGNAPAAGAFNDGPLTKWLAENRGVAFERRLAAAHPIWTGPSNMSAVFFITGDTSDVTVTGMRLYAPAGAGGDRFVPMAFSLSANYMSNQVVTTATPRTTAHVAVPHDLTFTNIDLDGIYMGWQGNAQNVVFDTIRSHRYADLQDANGGTVGGVGKWFAPPHLFYLNYLTTGDPGLFNRNIRIHDVVDSGPRIGVARDKGGSDTISGYAQSLKIGGIGISVDQYTSNRPDGFIDVLASDGLRISNVTATYDSAFLNNLFPGWRFPQTPYRNLTFENITLSDTAASSVQKPIGDTNQPSNERIVFSNVLVEVNRWSGQDFPIPLIEGHENEVALNFVIASDSLRGISSQKGNLSVVLEAAPATLRVGGATVLTWSSSRADTCSAGGAWSGALAPRGTLAVNMNAAGDHEFLLDCQNSAESLNTGLHVAVQ
jgi:hypothetical protein